MDPTAAPTHADPATAGSAGGFTTPALADQFVSAWLAKQVPDTGPERQLRLLARAILALCDDALGALGDLTVDTIITRVMALAAQRYPLLAPQRSSVLRIAGLEGVRIWAQADHPSEILPVSRFVLVRLLTDLDGLAHELRTPALYARITAVESEEPAERSMT